MYALEAVTRALGALLLLCVIFVPLGLWKLIELVFWVSQHITFQ